ncbi:Transcription initiation factor TFIID subunit 11 [Porphyridium purpureum]|uniref:Transcription initiation factor TFIID subunit 11 n=1 Tax=Porphyridium purpureum TaxID=35688 RepID=A0A5J4YXJ2_PORPP|nr:Transcription initiation factor TFIID subunit 11 [Porphyridium purpureum]|eukprot:POR6936..scf209_3
MASDARKRKADALGEEAHHAEPEPGKVSGLEHKDMVEQGEGPGQERDESSLSDFPPTGTASSPPVKRRTRPSELNEGRATSHVNQLVQQKGDVEGGGAEEGRDGDRGSRELQAQPQDDEYFARAGDNLISEYFEAAGDEEDATARGEEAIQDIYGVVMEQDNESEEEEDEQRDADDSEGEDEEENEEPLGGMEAAVDGPGFSFADGEEDEEEDDGEELDTDLLLDDQNELEKMDSEVLHGADWWQEGDSASDDDQEIEMEDPPGANIEDPKKDDFNVDRIREREFELVEKLSDEQMQRYEAMRRSDLKKEKIKKLLIAINPAFGTMAPKDPYVLAIKGLGKVFVGDVVETALKVRDARGEQGPLQPKHLREAYRRLQADIQNPVRHKCLHEFL